MQVHLSSVLYMLKGQQFLGKVIYATIDVLTLNVKYAAVQYFIAII